MLATAIAVLTLAPSASATPLADRVLDEVPTPMGVGVDGPLVAYARRSATGRGQVVVRDGARPVVRLVAGTRSSPVDVGRDIQGRRVVLYGRCDSRCDLVAFTPSTGHSRVVARSVRAADVTVGRGRAFWIDAKAVRSRALDGGPIRREAVVGDMDPTELDTDGTTLAVTGDLPGDFDGGATGLSVTRVGSGRALLRGRRTYSEEYAGMRGPVVTPTGVTVLFDGLVPGVPLSFADFATGAKGRQARTTGGMQIVGWDAAGGSTVFVEGPTSDGCGAAAAFSDERIAAVPCRIVLAARAGERLLPPRIAVTQTSATVLQTTLRGGTVTGRVPLAGVPVQLRDADGVLARLVTDAQGRVTLPTDEVDGGLTVVAATTPPSYAYDG
ncbi:MAG: hypothetical protein JWO02_4015 [Solirubrobacterales bacterium]|nr:hypothetical protein [Solirubrobacterales bacterium]